MLTTNYVWTVKAQEYAKSRGLESRIAGQVANFAFKPLERSPITIDAWLEIGEIRKVDKPRPFLNFHSKQAEDLIHMDMIRFFQENGIRYRYKDFLNNDIEAAIIDDEYAPVEYKHLDGDCYMVTVKGVPFKTLFTVAEKQKRGEL